MNHQNPAHHHSGHPHRALINTLLECAQACEQCMSACLDEPDVTPMAYCIELDRDCAELCFLGARLLLRDSEIAQSYLRVCEEACRLCAEACSMHDHDHCKRCAEACRRCEEACHQQYTQQQPS
ncbi:MAG: four-helix bundle copper-binding protein [Chitinophagaceae bacterium]|nr:MAG: four-helix bundle copper-binding protein [Chitinophagaceae bacterium]